MRKNDNNFNVYFLVIGYANLDLGSLDTLKFELLSGLTLSDSACVPFLG